MSKRNSENERIKRQFLQHLRRARGKSEKTVLDSAAAIDRFLEANGHKPLKKFHRRQAIAFCERFEEVRNERGALLSKVTVTKTLKALGEFFGWLSEQPGYKSRISSTDAEYFTPSRHAQEVARSKRTQFVPTIEQVHMVIAAMPNATVIQRRNRTLIAFMLLACPRNAAAASLKLRHLDLGARTLFQDGSEVQTKFRKSITTGFYPVGGKANAIVRDWVEELVTKYGFGPDEPIFPRTKNERSKETGLFKPVGIDRAPWRSGGSLRDVFRAAFEGAGLPYASPHSFRHTLARYAIKLDLSAIELAAWSRNLGHADVMTTLQSYTKMSDTEQVEIISAITRPEDRAKSDQKLNEIIRIIQNS
jgi:integrase